MCGGIFKDTIQRKHMMMVAVALVNVLLFSGVVFGFPALQLMLKQEGQFAELCDFPKDASPQTIADGCSEQTLKLSLMFTVASFLVNGISLPSGIFLDRWGGERNGEGERRREEWIVYKCRTNALMRHSPQLSIARE